MVLLAVRVVAVVVVLRVALVRVRCLRAPALRAVAGVFGGTPLAGLGHALLEDLFEGLVVAGRADKLIVVGRDLRPGSLGGRFVWLRPRGEDRGHDPGSLGKKVQRGVSRRSEAGGNGHVEGLAARDGGLVRRRDDAFLDVVGLAWLVAVCAGRETLRTSVTGGWRQGSRRSCS